MNIILIPIPIFITIFLLFIIFANKKTTKKLDYYSNAQQDNKINYPLWLYKKYSSCDEYTCNDNSVKLMPSSAPNIFAKTNSHQNIDTEYLINPDTFCSNPSNAWKRPCPNYWLFEEK